MDKTKVILALVVATIFLLSIAGCQLPQYNPEDTTAKDTGEDDLANELEKLTSDIEGEEVEGEVVDEAVADTEMTEEEKAKEEFKRKLLEKQAEAQAEAAAAAETATEEPAAEVTAVEPVEEVAAEEPVVVAQPVETTATETSGKLLKVTEGELVQLKLRANDPDGDPLSYSFTDPLDDDGKWQTKEGDAGTYKVTVSVTDGQVTVKDTLSIVVEPLNRVPVIEPIADITVNEGDTVNLNVEAYDPEGQSLTYKYSGWMTGPTKKTGYDDAGTHTVTVSVSDGVKEVSKTVKITVADKNRPPELTITW